jgi:hypothetical protein
MRIAAIRTWGLVAVTIVGPGCDKLTGSKDEPAAAKAEQTKSEAKAEDAKPEAKVEAKSEAKAEAKAETPAAPSIACPDGGSGKGAAPPAGHEQWCEIVVDGHSLRHGRWTRWFDASGKPWQEQEYRQGKRHGVATSWYENGKTAESGEYTDDEKSGHWTRFRDDGSKSEEGDYRARAVGRGRRATRPGGARGLRVPQRAHAGRQRAAERHGGVVREPGAQARGALPQVARRDHRPRRAAGRIRRGQEAGPVGRVLRLGRSQGRDRVARRQTRG